MLSCEKKSFEAERLVGSTSFQIPVRAESPVPGAGRESAEIVMEDAFASVSGAEAQQGRVLASGQVQCQAVYRLGAEGGLMALTAHAPFEQAVELEGVEPDMTVRVRAETEHVEAVYDNGHMVFTVSVTVYVRVRSLAQVEAVCAISGDETVEQRTESVSSAKISAENSETAELAESVSLPAALHARVVLMQWASPKAESAVRDLGGVRVSGEVQVESLIASSVAGRPVALVRCRLPFEQLVALPDWVDGEPEAETEVSRLGVTVEEGNEGEDAALKMTCALSVTVRLNAKDCVEAVSDAYIAGDGMLLLEKKELTLCAGCETVRARDIFRGTIPLPEGAPGAGTALAARVRPVVSGWREEQGGAVVEGILEATILYMPSGGDRMTSVRGDVPFELAMGRPLGGDAEVCVTVSEAEAAALMSDRMELKCVLQAKACVWQTADAAIVVGAEEGETVPRRRGICIAYPAAGEDIWCVGKKYRVSQSSVREADGAMIVAAAVPLPHRSAR